MVLQFINKLFRYSWVAMLVALVIFYFSCLLAGDDIPSIEIPYLDKVVHFLMYFGLALAISIQYIFMKRGQIIIMKLLVYAVVAPILYGGLIEILQTMYFERTGDWFDLIANILGVAFSVPIALWFRRFMLAIQED